MNMHTEIEEHISRVRELEGVYRVDVVQEHGAWFVIVDTNEGVSTYAITECEGDAGSSYIEFEPL